LLFIPFPLALHGFQTAVTAAIAALKTIVVVPNATGAESRAEFALTAAPVFALIAVIVRIAAQALARRAGYVRTAAAVIIAVHVLVVWTVTMVSSRAALSAAIAKPSSLLQMQTQVLTSMIPEFLILA